MTEQPSQPNTCPPTDLAQPNVRPEDITITAALSNKEIPPSIPADADSLATRAPPASDSRTSLPAGLDAIQVPGYEIERELGRGGMGVVYQARQVGLNRRVALKMILAGGHAAESELARFKTEAETLARLRHANIVQVYEVGECQGRPFFVLELCAGGSLERRLAGNPQPPKQAAELVAVLAGAMHAAHQAQVIHRDLKPANILLSFSRNAESSERSARHGTNGTDGTDGSHPAHSSHWSHHAIPKITDFGLAKKLDEAGQTQTGAVMGTPSYMAPEQAEGKKDVGPAADIYALGVILYECLTGRPPFKAATSFDTILQVVADDPVPPSRLQPGLPRDLETVCLKCLRKDPAKRYASAGALADDLGRWLAGEPIHARPVGATERGIKWVRRNPVVASLLGLIVTLTLTGVGLVLAQWRRAEGEWRRAEEQRAVAEEAGEEAARRAEAEKRASAAAKQAQDLADESSAQARQALREGRSNLYFYNVVRAQRDLRAGLTDRAALLLDGCPLDTRGWEWDHLRQRCGDEQVRCVGHTGEVLGVCWSPDGQTLASGSTDSTIRLWDPLTGREKQQLRGHDGWVGPPTFDPKGRWLVSNSAIINNGLVVLGGKWEQVVSTQIKMWNLPQGTEIRSLKGRGPVAFSPDGSLLAVIEGRSILLYDPVTGTIKRTLVGHGQPIFAVVFTPDGKTLISGSYDINRIAWNAWGNPAPMLVPGELKVWDVETGKERKREVPSPPTGVIHLALHRDGRLLVVGRIDGAVEVFDRTTGKLLHALRGRGSRLCGLDLDREGRLVVTPFGSKAIVWDIKTGRELAKPSGANQGVAFSPDGRRLAFGAAQGQPVRIIDANFGKEGLSLLGPVNVVAAVGFSPDHRHVAGLSAGKLFLWDLGTGKEVYSIASRGIRLAFVPGTEYLVTGGEPALFQGGELFLRETLTGKVLHRFTGHRQTVVSLTCSTDGRWLISADCNVSNGKQPGEVRVWDLKTRQAVRCISGQQHIFSVALSPDGTLIAGACLDRSVYLWERETGKLVRRLVGHTTLVNAVAFRLDGKQLASGGVDGTILLWNVATGQQEKELRGHQSAAGIGDGGIVTLAYSPDGRRLASSSFLPPTGGEVKLWDLGKEIEALDLGGRIALAFDGTWLAAGAGGGEEPWQVRIWEARPGAIVARYIKRHAGAVRAIVASADRRRFATVGDDGAVRVWDASSGDVSRVLKGHKGRVWHVAFSADGKLLASGGADRTVRIWDLETGKEPTVLTGHTGEVRAVAFSRNGILASGATDGTVRLWDAHQGTPIRSWVPSDKKNVYTVAFSPDGKQVLSGGDGIELRDVASGEFRFGCPEAEGDVMAAAFARDGKTFAAGDWKGVLRIYDARTGRLLRVLRDSNEPIFALDHRGDCIATVGNDRAVHLWDADGVARAVLSSHDTWVPGVAFVAGGLVASGDAHGEVRLWRVPSRPAGAQAPIPIEYPENLSYLARLAREHQRAGRHAEALEVSQRWDTAARRQWGFSDPSCVGLMFLAQHELSRPEAQETFIRFEDLTRNPRWAANDELKKLFRQCQERMGEVKRDAVVEKIKETLFEGQHAGWTRHDINRYLALFSDDYCATNGRAEKPREGDITTQRKVFEQQQRLQFSHKPDAAFRFLLEDVRITAKGNSAVARTRSTYTWPFGYFTVHAELHLRQTPAGWKVYREHWWPVQHRQGDKLVRFDEPTWKRLDEAADKEHDPSQRVELLLEARRFREAQPLAKEVTAKPNATAKDWQFRAEAAYNLGDIADTTLSARRAKMLDKDSFLPPYLDAARRLP